jgi:hypothetical protein
MTGYFTPDEIVAQLRDDHARGKCQHEEKRANLQELVRQDIARLICAVSNTNYFSYLIAKRGDMALVIGTRGDLRSHTITLELIRRRQRVAYFSYSDPILHTSDLRRRECMAERKGKNALKIHVHEATLANLLTMRALLYTKLPTQGRVLTTPVN